MRPISSSLVAALTLGLLPAALHGQLQARGTAAIDGLDSPGEWTNAATVTDELTSGISGGTSTVTFSTMSDDDNLYVSVRLPLDGALIGTDAMVVVVSASLSGPCPPRPIVDEHRVFVDSVGFGHTDRHWSGGADCTWDTSSYDDDDGGTTDGAGAVLDEGSAFFFEVAIPLDSGDDAHDLSVGVTQTLSLYLVALACRSGDCGVPAEANASLLLVADHGAIFADGFETRNTLAWGAEIPRLPTPDVFRWTDLDLRDPHVYANLSVFGCQDVTDNTPAGPGQSINSYIQQAISTDGNGDGKLDLSELLAFRPFDPLATGGRLDIGDGACAAPSPPASCGWRIPPLPRSITYDVLAAGTCLAPLAGTTHAYSPGVASMTGPCYVSAPIDVSIPLFGASVPLRAARSAAHLDGNDPPALLAPGLWMGFLRESDADAVIVTISGLGTAPLSSLLPGGSGNCAAHDDRDLGPDSESGWWIYFDFVASPVVFVGR